MFLEKVIKSLNNHKVDYCLVGGYAVALHGAVRGTVDIDIVININVTDLTLAQRALNSLGLVNHLPITPQDLFQFRDEYIKKKNLLAWNFVNPKNPTEAVDILILYDLQQLETVVKTIARLKVKVISIKDLIKIKKKAGRPQDLLDVKALEELI